MRTNLFLSTLFAVSLLGGAALANKPGVERPVREPRTIQAFRAHGDVVDKSYRSTDRATRQSHVDDSSAAKTHGQRTPAPNDRASSRINCSDTGADCGTSSRNAAKPEVRGASQSPVKPTSAAPQKSSGNERMNCNEADECMMSSKDAKKIWAYEAVKAGTFNGPIDAAAQKDTNAQAKQDQQRKDQAAQEKSAKEKSAKDSDTQH